MNTYIKKVGNKVLHLDCDCLRYQRMYLHGANRIYATAVTLYEINLEMAKARFELNGILHYMEQCLNSTSEELLIFRGYSRINPIFGIFICCELLPTTDTEHTIDQIR